MLWPAGLRELVFGACFDHPVNAIAWPSTLESLVAPTAIGLTHGEVVAGVYQSWLTENNF